MKIPVYLSDSLKTLDFPAFSAGLLPYKALFSLVFALVGLKRGIFMPDSAILMKDLAV